MQQPVPEESPRLVEVSLSFYVQPDGMHALCVIQTETRGIELTIIHEGITSVTPLDTVFGSCTETIAVQGGETITLLARFDGEVTAAGVYQVDTDLVETLGLLLRPCCQTCILLVQDAAAYLDELPQVSAAEVARA